MWNRDKAIETLIGDDLDSISQGYVDGIWYSLAEGFKGYNNMTDDELMQELQERDISILFGEVE
jgi:hypothetical protein